MKKIEDFKKNVMGKFMLRELIVNFEDFLQSNSLIMQ